MIDLIKGMVDFILHINVHLGEIVSEYRYWTYAILFLIIFAETGFVVTPFLPGDSLLFAAGTLSALADNALNVHLVALLLWAAAVLGDTVNYWVGHCVGPAVFKREDSLLLRKKHLERAHEFFEKYGSLAIILARFVPIVRTFVPFVAGVGSMTYKKFITYNVIGGFAWIYAFVYAGFFIGNIEIVKKNFSLVVLCIIIVSVIPMAVTVVKAWLDGRKKTADTAR
jgi:membrane-associated protein